jgi:hypothetical protein
MKNNIIISLLMCLLVSAQAQEKDMQTWLTLELSVPVLNKFEFALENEIRFYNNTSLLGRNQYEFELYYLHDKHWSFGLGYRARTEYPFSEYSDFRHRWLTDVIWKTRVKKRWRINTRLRLQNDQEVFLGEEPAGMVHREKIRLAYRIRRSPFLVYTAMETYFPLESSRLFELRKFRLTAGTRIQVSTKSRVTVDLIFDKEYNRLNPLTAYVLQLGYSIDLGRSDGD